MNQIASKYGYFNPDGTEFIITDPKTPRAFDNFLWNDSLFSVVHQSGVGFFDYQIGNTEAVKLLTGIGRICDFDVFGREGLMSRLIYVRDNCTGEFWNVNWEPVKKEYSSYQCTHGLGYSIIESEVCGIGATFRIFVPEGADPVELWTLQFRNFSAEKRDLSVFIYNQFSFKYKWDFNSYGDMIFRKCCFNESLNAMVANKHPQISPHQFQTGFMTSDLKIDGFDGNRDSFMGIYNGYNEPEAVIRGRCSNTEGSSDSTVGVTQYNFTIDPEGSQSINMILGVTDEESNISALKDKYLSRMDEYFHSLKSSGRKFAAMNHVKTPDEHLNRMVNVWMKHQSSYGAKWCRWGWMGYRDIVQHGYGVSSFNPERTREILEEALKYQYQNGMALRGWNPVDTKAYSDSALWLVFAIISYMKETADFGFFEKKIGFFDGGFATVLEHIEKALDFLETNKGSHGLCLIKFGDWNDSLTAIGKEGKGESVWLSMAYAEAVRLMAELYKFLKLHEKEKDFNRRYEDIKSAVNKHAWDGGWYIRCFDDNGRAVGSERCDEGKIFVNTQSWAMIAGVADEERTIKMLHSAKEKLLTKSGYLLLAPTFMKPDPHIGRISCLEPGICENGTVYSHANAWMVLGLLRAKRPDEAYEIFKRLTPGYFTSEDDVKQKSPPYIYANGYFGPAHRNNAFLAEFTWITGSVAWHYNNVVREMIGIKPEYDGLLIEPNLPASWDHVEAQRTFRDKNFSITICRDGTGQRSVVLNGKKMESAFIPLEVCRENNRVEVTL